MNGIDDNFEPDDSEPREPARRMLGGAAKVCMAASFLALPMAVVDRNGGWLTGAVVGLVLYLVLSHFSVVNGEPDVL